MGGQDHANVGQQTVDSIAVEAAEVGDLPGGQVLAKKPHDLPGFGF